jgi:hypothetical protein
MRANKGRMAGIQAQMMPVLISIADNVACAGLSNEMSLLLATSLRVYRRITEISGALYNVS